MLLLLVRLCSTLCRTNLNKSKRLRAVLRWGDFAKLKLADFKLIIVKSLKSEQPTSAEDPGLSVHRGDNCQLRSR